jgi:UbiD family decarboxylase
MSDLRGYLSAVERSKDLMVVKRQVSARYEIAAVTAKADGRRAIMFEDIEGSRFRLVSNLVGTRERFAMAVGSGRDDIHKRMISCIDGAAKPHTTERGRFMENRSRDASSLPAVTHFEKEPGPFITSSIVYAQNPESKRQNSSFHRMMPVDGTHFSVRMVEGRHLHRCFTDAKQHGEDLRVSVTVGVHPAVSIAGAYQAEWGNDELDIANSILDGNLTLAGCPYSGMLVPSESEIVMEGRILQDVTHPEWMVEMLQTYDHRRDQPVFELESLYFRNDPIFHDILSGFSEHRLLMGMPIESKLNYEMRMAFPQTRRVSMTGGGCSWLHAVVQAEKRSDLDPKEIIQKMFRLHRSLKQVTVVDPDIDPDSAESVEYAMATRFQADRDLVIIKDVRGSSLDPSSDQENLRTAKMGIDATRPLSKRPEGFEVAKIPGSDEVSLDDYC